MRCNGNFRYVCILYFIAAAITISGQCEKACSVENWSQVIKYNQRKFSC